ncbi:MAG: 50S ribosomal protein L10 [Planctomycetota bacterium]|nr:50S ribosomal protein L10 [Planctomycetota bacterium]
MSKFVKNLIVDQIKKELAEVQDCVLVNVIGLNAEESGKLRDRLHEKSIHIRVVKKSLAVRATEGTSLAPAFDGIGGSVAVCWGGNDFVSMVKELVELDKDEDNFETFATCGGVLDGEALTPAAVAEISKWPTREEALSTLVGQLLGPGATLAAQLIGPGGTLAAQIVEIDGEGAEEEATEEAPAEEASADTVEEAAEEEATEEAPAEEASADTVEEAAKEESTEEAPAEEAGADTEEEDADEGSEE